MGHLRDICVHRLSTDVLTNRKNQIGGKFGKLRRLHQIPKRHRRIFLIRHLDAHRRLPGDRGLDPDLRRCQAQLDIICQTDDLAHLHPLLRVELIAGHRGPAADVGHRDADAEVPEGLLQLDRRLLVGLLGKCACAPVPSF